MHRFRVQVATENDVDGFTKPMSVIVDDEEYLVSRILSTQPLCSLKACKGGDGLRYKCVIEGRIVYLSYNETAHIWHMELPAA